jgi:alpha-galactosidase
MLEFRQKYIGPFMRQYGNMFRVADCPLDFIANRNGVVDLKLLSGNTAVHSDMIMWNKNDNVESAALQIINILFSVPQISVKLNKQPCEHMQMLTHWLSFWEKNRETLLFGDIETSKPELNNLYICSKYKNNLIISIFADVVVDVNEIFPDMIIINGKLTENIVINLSKQANLQIIVYTCLGNVVKQEKSVIEGLYKIEIPKAGYAEITAI